MYSKHYIYLIVFLLFAYLIVMGKVEMQDCRRNRSISHPDCWGVEEMRVLTKEPVQGEGDNVFERQGKAFHYVPFIMVTCL